MAGVPDEVPVGIRPQVLVTDGLVVGDTVVRAADGALTSGQAIKTGE